MHRCLIDPAQWREPEILLGPDESHHLVHVLRAREGGSLEALDGHGRRASARISSITHDVRRAGRGPTQAAIQLTSAVRDCPRPTPTIDLLVAMPKGSRMDGLIEKATELGVTAIHPLLTERVVARPSQKESEGRVERWKRISESALRQCGTPWLPTLHPVSPLGISMDGCLPYDLLLIGALTENAVPLREILDRYRDPVIRRAAVLIGPEGDLTPAEMARAEQAGGIAVSFGDNVLRVDTAALFVLSALRFAFGRAEG